MLKSPLVSGSNLTDLAIPAAVERSVGKAFIQEEMGKHANEIAFQVGPGWFCECESVCVLGRVCGGVELAEAKSLLAQAELIEAIAGNHPLGMFLREIPSRGRKPFKGKVRC